MTELSADSQPALARAPHAADWFWRTAFPLCIPLAYLALMVPLVCRHSLWRDEAQAFLIARDSSSLLDMFHNLRFEGHPPLWYLLLYPLTRLAPYPAAMQWLDLLLATATVYLVARRAPFPRLAKFLFPFGYYVVFEYGLLARNYQLVLLFSVLFCTLWSARRNAYIRLGLILALLSLSHALGVIIVTGLGLMLFLDALSRRDDHNRRLASSWRFPLGCILGAAGTLAAAALASPASGAATPNKWTFDLHPDHLAQTLQAMTSAYLPLSPWQLHFRDATIFTNTTGALCGGVLLLITILSLITSWRALLFFLVAEGGLLAFFHLKFPGVWHHHGLLFIVWILALWIQWTERSPAASRLLLWTRQRLPQALLLLLLVLQVYAACVPIYFCWNYPFSRGQDAAAFLRHELQPGDVIASDLPVVTASIAAYLPGILIYYPAERRWGSYAIWTTRWWVGATASQIFAFAQTQPHRVFLIHCSTHGDLPGCKKLAVFPAGITEYEEFTIFEMDGEPVASAPANPPHEHPVAPRRR